MVTNPPAPLLLGVDIGTTNLKLLAMHADTLAIVAQVTKPVETFSPKPNYAEQNPEAIWHLLLAGLSELQPLLANAGGAIHALCFSTAMHSLLAVDEAEKPLTNALIWADNRATEQATTLKKNHGDLYKTIGVPLHPMLPLCKLAWFARHEPRLLKRAARWISIKEFIWHKLTGHHEVDYSMAAATGLFDSQTRTWHPPALALAGVRAEQLSRPVGTTCTRIGAGPPLPGLSAETWLVIGASDGCLANLGAGGMAPGITTITIGTSGAVRRTNPRPIRDSQSRLFSYPLFLAEKTTGQHIPNWQSDQYVVGGPSNNGGNVLDWLAEKIVKTDVPAVLTAAATVPPGAEGLLFRPYLHGERAPLWDATVRGSYHHLDHRHTQAHLIRAALEGVLFNLRTIDLLLARHTGPTRLIHANGGFARSDFWVQMLADMFGVPVRLNASSESSAIGAVLLARYALQNLRANPVSLAELSGQVTFDNTVQPNSAAHRTYLAAYKQFAALCPPP